MGISMIMSVKHPTNSNNSWQLRAWFCSHMDQSSQSLQEAWYHHYSESTGEETEAQRGEAMHPGDSAGGGRAGV